MTSHSHSHSHDGHHHHDINPHTDLDALGSKSDSDAALHAGAIRTEKIAKFLEAHFGDVEVVETREVEVVSGEDTAMGEGDEGATTEQNGETKEEGSGKMLVFEPAIVVRLDAYEARIGLVDLVSFYFRTSPGLSLMPLSPFGRSSNQRMLPSRNVSSRSLRWR